MSDLISRQAAIDAVNTALFPKINTAKDAEKALRELPSAERHGRWVDDKFEDGEWYHTCSVCGMQLRRDAFDNFCGNCGARMAVEE